MKKNLADIMTEIATAKATGILSLSLSNDSSLFKIFYRKGIIYHITHSTCKDKECLSGMADHTFLSGLFIPGAQVEMQNDALLSNEEVISLARKANKVLEWSGHWDGVLKPSEDKKSDPSTVIDTAVIDKMSQELVNIAGPVASIVLANAFSSCGLKQGQPMTKMQFQTLVKTISSQLPEEHREPFIRKML